MILVVAFCLELLILFFLSRWLNQSLFLFFARLFRSRNGGIFGATTILFPGTIIHELSHLFSAEILQVKTGKLSLIPEIIDDESIQAGSVQVARSDPLRRTIIGIAPLIVGVIVVTLLSHQLTRLYPTVLSAITAQTSLLDLQPITLVFAFLSYLLFAISNNMFPSKEDMKGVPAVFIVIGLLFITAYIVGVRFTLSGSALTLGQQIISSLTINLAVVILFNIGLLFIIRLIMLIQAKLQKLRFK